MFLRSTKRFKDGKVHYYWSMVENVRVGRRAFQRQALYLGELNDSQREKWQRAVEAFDEKGNVRQLKLFPEDRAPETDDGQVVRIRMDRLTVRNVRNWGEVWLGREMWDKLGLDGFWAPRLGASCKGTDWLALMKAIVLYRFTDPGSELRMHTNWIANTAVGELIGPGALTGRSTLYSCLDRVIWNSDEWKKPRGERKGSFKDEFFCFLRDRWAGPFGSTCDVVLFDLTSTYFEVDGTKALESDLQRYGYSRDTRGDCLQVVVALVLTPDGFPLAYEVMPGNTSDKETSMRAKRIRSAMKKLFKLDERIREARANDEGTYLLRTNLPECDPKTLWRRYMIQGEIEYAFRELKNGLGLRPVYHSLDDRIEAHIFTAFMALCLLQTLRAIAREHAPGLTPRQIIDKFRTVKMVDVVMPTTDGRIVTLPRYVEPKPDLMILLDRLGLTLPVQPPPKISSEAAESAKTTV